MTHQAALAQALAAGVFLMAPGCTPDVTAPSAVDGLPVAAAATAGSSSADWLRKADTSSPVTATVANLLVSVTVAPGGAAALPLDPGPYLVTFTQNGVTLAASVPTVWSFVGHSVEFLLQSGDDTILVTLSISGRPLPPACTIAGAAIGSFLDLQGTVATGDAGSFELDVDDALTPALVAVSAAGAIYRCVGQANGTCQVGMGPGAKVHVKGTFSGCSGSAPVVTATEVKVQKLP